MFNHKELIDKIGVYKIINLINNKVYIGSSCSSLYKRLYAHLSSLQKGKHTNRHLQKAFIKYGQSNFRFEILEVCINKDETLKREEFYINTLQSFLTEKGYNIFQFATTTKGNTWSDEAKINRKGYGKGRIVSNETKRKQSLIAIGKKVKESTKEKLRLLNTNPIVMLDLDGNYIKEFRNCTEASIYFNLVPSGYVCSVLSGKRKTCKGYRLMLKKDYNPDSIKRITSGKTSNIIQYDLQDNKIKEFLSIKEAELELGIKGANANISACCKGNRKSAYNFVWKYNK